MKHLVFIVSFIILSSQGVWAQSLLHSKPLEFNPGFAGNKTYDRLSFHGGEISYNTRNLYFSYDRLVKPLKGGIGFYAHREFLNQTTDLYHSEKNEKTTIGAIYSPKIIVKRKYLLSPFADVAGILGKTQYTSKIDEVTALLISKETQSFFRLKTGMLVNSDKLYAGYSLANTWGDEWYVLHQMQAGYVYSLCAKENLLFDFRWNVGNPSPMWMRHYKTQLNTTFQHSHLFVGMGVNDGRYFSALTGVKLVNLKIALAYHLLPSPKMNNIELGVQYVFDPNNKDKVILPFEKWYLKRKM